MASAYLRVTGVRRDALHKATAVLARTKSVICVEDLCMQSMIATRSLLAR